MPSLNQSAFSRLSLEYRPRRILPPDVFRMQYQEFVAIQKSCLKHSDKPISGAGVTAAVQLRETLAGNMRINLRGRDIRMAQQKLHDPQISAVIQQVSGKRVTQNVR